MLCPKCLCEIPDESNVCALCGAELSATATAAESEVVAAEADVVMDPTLLDTIDDATKAKKEKLGLIFGIAGLALSAAPILIELCAFIPLVGWIISLMLSGLIVPCRILGAVASVVGLIIGLKNKKLGIGKLGLTLSFAGLIVGAVYAAYLFITKLAAILFGVGFYVIYFVIALLMALLSGL